MSNTSNTTPVTATGAALGLFIIMHHMLVVAPLQFMIMGSLFSKNPDP